MPYFLGYLERRLIGITDSRIRSAPRAVYPGGAKLRMCV